MLMFKPAPSEGPWAGVLPREKYTAFDSRNTVSSAAIQPLLHTTALGKYIPSRLLPLRRSGRVQNDDSLSATALTSKRRREERGIVYISIKLSYHWISPKSLLQGLKGYQLPLPVSCQVEWNTSTTSVLIPSSSSAPIFSLSFLLPSFASFLLPLLFTSFLTLIFLRYSSPSIFIHTPA